MSPIYDDGWIWTYSAAVASGRSTNLANFSWNRILQIQIKWDLVAWTLLYLL